LNQLRLRGLELLVGLLELAHHFAPQLLCLFALGDVAPHPGVVDQVSPLVVQRKDRQVEVDGIALFW
jgi:hypothetical protein